MQRKIFLSEKKKLKNLNCYFFQIFLQRVQFCIVSFVYKNLFMNNIAIFASGSGTNAENIAAYFQKHDKIQVKLILTNNPTAGVIQRAKKMGVKYVIFSRYEFYNSQNVFEILRQNEIHWIILAGFLWLVPAGLVAKFSNRIVNIHPALLPNYGGKGMYGMNVHQAVVEAGETESGITIHYVNEAYDKGDIIAQYKCRLSDGETAESLAQKIHELEYKYFPVEIEKLLH